MRHARLPHCFELLPDSHWHCRALATEKMTSADVANVGTDEGNRACQIGCRCSLVVAHPNAKFASYAHLSLGAGGVLVQLDVLTQEFVVIRQQILIGRSQSDIQGLSSLFDRFSGGNLQRLGCLCSSRTELSTTRGTSSRLLRDIFFRFRGDWYISIGGGGGD